MEATAKKNVGTLSGQVREYILTKILNGEFEPGERLIEMKIAHQMQTSQAPVREAIRELEATGLLETLPNRGSRVRKVSNQELFDIYDVRAQLEGYAAEIVCQKKISISNELTEAVERMIEAGVCREQARGVLPQNMYTEYYGTTNLNNLLKFIDLRTHEGAQWEIQKVAEACLDIANDLWPTAVTAYREQRND